VIAVVHERECSQNWTGSLAQGDPWNKVSVHVPAGRGPFSSWEEAAVDALNDCAPYAGRNKDWSIGALLTVLEEYNGLGYAARGVPSPYVWSGTDQYRSGKYVRDGVYDPHVVDGQLGCAGLLKAMMALDPSITLGGAALVPIAPKGPKASLPAPSFPKPSFTKPAVGSIGAWVACTFSAIFKSKGK
jgi:lysozyme family protein